MSDDFTVSFDELRRLRDIAGQLGSRTLAAALEELVHLRDARSVEIDGVFVGSNVRITPDDLKTVRGRTPRKPDRRVGDRRAARRRQDDKTKARLK